MVLDRGEGVWVWDVDGNRYLDMLAAYSALNQGHRHPEIMRAAEEQMAKLTLTSRAFHNDQLGPFLRELCEATGFEKALPMNTGAEAVETAIKTVRKWGYQVKGVPEGEAEIIVCENNFHGRTTTIVGFSSEDQYKDGFGPFTPGFVMVPYGDVEAFEAAITENTGRLPHGASAGRGRSRRTPGRLPEPDGRDLPRARNRLRGRRDPDRTRSHRSSLLLRLGGRPARRAHRRKALGGGVYPVSAAIADSEFMDLYRPGDHGSTFGGNPLGAAVGRASLRVILEENLSQRSDELGNWFMDELRAIDSPHVEEVRGRGLMVGVVIKESSGTARPYCEALQEKGILAKETHHQVVRFAPPLTIEKSTLEEALVDIDAVLTG